MIDITFFKMNQILRKILRKIVRIFIKLITRQAKIYASLYLKKFKFLAFLMEFRLIRNIVYYLREKK